MSEFHAGPLGLGTQEGGVRLHRSGISGGATSDEDVDSETVDLGSDGGDVVLHPLRREVAGGEEPESAGTVHRHGQRGGGWPACHRCLDNRHGQPSEDTAHHRSGVDHRLTGPNLRRVRRHLEWPSETSSMTSAASASVLDDGDGRAGSQFQRGVRGWPRPRFRPGPDQGDQYQAAQRPRPTTPTMNTNRASGWRSTPAICVPTTGPTGRGITSRRFGPGTDGDPPSGERDGAAAAPAHKCQSRAQGEHAEEDPEGDGEGRPPKGRAVGGRGTRHTSRRGPGRRKAPWIERAVSEHVFGRASLGLGFLEISGEVGRHLVGDGIRDSEPPPLPAALIDESFTALPPL